MNLVTITDAIDISGQQLPHLTQPFDIALCLTLDVGRDFQPELIIGGNFKKDVNTNNVIGWGSGFLVQDVMNRLGYNGPLEEGNSIPRTALQSLVGKKFYRLSFVSGIRDNGKFRYSDWNQIASENEGTESLMKRFMQSVAKGYPKHYKPELLEQVVLENSKKNDDESF